MPAIETSKIDLDLQLLRITQVGEFMALRKSKLYADVSAGLLTPPIHHGARASVWPKYEIVAINAARLSGASDDEVRKLVRRLIGKRAELAAQILGQAA